MSTTLEASYAACRARSRAAGSSFALGMRMLPPAKRRALESIYAFCRLADDIADGAAPGRDLAECAALLAGDLGRDPIGAALADTLARFRIPPQVLAEVLEGCRQDARQTCYATWAELEGYARRVAVGPGLAALEVFGYRDPAARVHAEALGQALQLVNIIRDVGEDARRGRVYLPEEELARHGARPEDCRAERTAAPLSAALAAAAGRALTRFHQAEPLYDLVAADARACPLGMALAYRRILARMASDGFRVLERRYRLGVGARLGVLWTVWRQGRSTSRV